MILGILSSEVLQWYIICALAEPYIYIHSKSQVIPTHISGTVARSRFETLFLVVVLRNVNTMVGIHNHWGTFHFSILKLKTPDAKFLFEQSHSIFYLYHIITHNLWLYHGEQGIKVKQGRENKKEMNEWSMSWNMFREVHPHLNFAICKIKSGW